MVWRKRTLSIRARLMVLAVIAIVPLLVDRVHEVELDRGERIGAAYKQALGSARQAIAAQNEVVVGARALLHAVASARATFAASNESCNQFLANTAGPVPWIKALSVANVQGIIVCSSYPEAIGLDVSDRPHFIGAVDSGDFVLSDFFYGTRVNAPILIAALAQRGPNGGAAAVVLGSLDLNWFSRAATTLELPFSSVMLMIDGEGSVIAHHPNSDDWVGRKFKDHPLVREFLARPDGVVTETSLDGVRRIFGFAQLPGTRARLAVGFDESEVLARVNRAMWTDFAKLAFIAGLVLIGIWFGGERLLVKPIRALAATASRIGRGEVKTHAVDMPWVAEFIPLAVALDDMSAQLVAREQELRDSNSQLRELANIDALTGLANRRTFNTQLAAEWKMAAKLQQPLAVLMIDVDHFKLFNDHYGHVQGDACLRKVAGVLKAATRTAPAPTAQVPTAHMPPSYRGIAADSRKSDFAARYGGEEFAVVLQGAGLEAAQRVAERLRRGVEELLMAHAGASWGFVSISVGVACVVPTAQDDPQLLTEIADAALYQAKQRGRNTVAAQSAMTLSQAS